MAIGHNSGVRGTFADFKTVKTRGVCQLIIEVPIEAADHALAVLGGVPQAKAEQWVGLAPITAPETTTEAPKAPDVPETPDEQKHPVHRSWGELSPTQQAGIACHDPDFQRWICTDGSEVCESEAARLVRSACNVSSRSHIGIYPASATAWGKLYTQFKASQYGQTDETLAEQARM